MHHFSLHVDSYKYTDRQPNRQTYHCITLHYITLHYIALHYITLHVYMYIPQPHNSSSLAVSDPPIPSPEIFGCRPAAVLDSISGE